MLKIIFNIFTYLLAIYGVMYLIVAVVNSTRQRLSSESTRVRMILIVKNQEQTIEGIIRNIFTGDILRKVMSNEKLIIVDMGSTDKTVEILKKLRNDYLFFDILEAGEKENIFLPFDDSIGEIINHS